MVSSLFLRHSGLRPDGRRKKAPVKKKGLLHEANNGDRYKAARSRNPLRNAHRIPLYNHGKSGNGNNARHVPKSSDRYSPKNSIRSRAKSNEAVVKTAKKLYRKDQITPIITAAFQHAAGLYRNRHHRGIRHVVFHRSDRTLYSKLIPKIPLLTAL